MQWRRNNTVLSASFQNSINRNPVSLVDHRSESRQFGLQGSWAAPSGRFTLDAGYTLHIDAAVEDMRNSPNEVAAPLTTKGAGSPIAGRRYVASFAYDM